LPIVSLRSAFGFDAREHDDTSRALVIDLGQPLGFVVDRVASVVGVESAKIEGVDSIQGTINTALLSGIIKDVGGHAMIMVLDFAKVVAQEFSDMVFVAKNSIAGMGSTTSTEDEDEDISDELQLVSFEVAEQEYAIAISDVQEIVQIPASIVHVPHSESHVLGVMTLRNRLLPLVSLRSMFELPPKEVDDQSRIVVVSTGAASVGIVMDSVNAVLRVALKDVDAMPNLLTRDSASADVSQICRLDGGKRLVSIISASSLFRHNVVKEALIEMEDSLVLAQPGEVIAVEELTDDEQMVVFRLGKEEYGAPIESVQEIVRVPEELTRVPNAPPFVEGVINLRGSVLPVVDLRRRLGLQTVCRSDQQRVMVFLIDGMRTGFIVDSVTEVLRIRKPPVSD